MTERAQSESVLVMYGVLAGGARMFLPPAVDLPVVRTIRAAMLDRMARAHGVTLTVGARRILVDIESVGTLRGNVAQGARWVIGRLLPGGRAVDAVNNLLRTYGVGALMQRYFTEFRPTDDAVLAEIEAERIRVALRAALNIMEVGHVLSIVDEALLPVRQARVSTDLGPVARWGEAAAATVAELPAAWLDAAERVFVTTLRQYG